MTCLRPTINHKDHKITRSKDQKITRSADLLEADLDIAHQTIVYVVARRVVNLFDPVVLHEPDDGEDGRSGVHQLEEDNRGVIGGVPAGKVSGNVNHELGIVRIRKATVKAPGVSTCYCERKHEHMAFARTCASIKRSQDHKKRKPVED